MATAAVAVRMTLEEYLHTTFRPDVEFVDGVVEERNVGEWEHGGLQGILCFMLMTKESEWGVLVTPELRTQTAPRNFRVPDVSVIDARDKVKRWLTKAPLLCVEVLSPEDRLNAMLKRVKDFHSMGVGQVWIFDPEAEKVWVSTPDGVMEWSGGVLTVPGTKIELDPAMAFAKLAARR